MEGASLTDAVAAYLLQRRGSWVDGRELARVGGAYAWRSRVSDARRRWGLEIENRVRWIPWGLEIEEYRVPERASLTDAVAAYLLQRRGSWVDGRELARVGGAYAWRSRVSDARRRWGLEIENRVRWIEIHGDAARRVRVSEYRVPERASLTDAVAAYLLQRRGSWVDGRELARVGGAYAWRSRVSDARRRWGLEIENRVRWIEIHGDAARRVRVSEYRVPERA